MYTHVSQQVYSVSDYTVYLIIFLHSIYTQFVANYKNINLSIEHLLNNDQKFVLCSSVLQNLPLAVHLNNGIITYDRMTVTHVS